MLEIRYPGPEQPSHYINTETGEQAPCPESPQLNNVMAFLFREINRLNDKITDLEDAQHGGFTFKF